MKSCCFWVGQLFFLSSAVCLILLILLDYAYMIQYKVVLSIKIYDVVVMSAVCLLSAICLLLLNICDRALATCTWPG